MKKNKTKGIELIKVLPCFLLPGRIKHRSSASFFYCCHKSVPSLTHMMWELEEFNPSYRLKITVSSCACTKCAHGAFVAKWPKALEPPSCYIWSNTFYIDAFILLLTLMHCFQRTKNSASYPKLILKRVKYNHKVVTVHKLHRAALWDDATNTKSVCYCKWHCHYALTQHPCSSGA